MKARGFSADQIAFGKSVSGPRREERWVQHPVPQLAPQTAGTFSMRRRGPETAKTDSKRTGETHAQQGWTPGGGCRDISPRPLHGAWDQRLLRQGLELKVC